MKLLILNRKMSLSLRKRGRDASTPVPVLSPVYHHHQGGNDQNSLGLHDMTLIKVEVFYLLTRQLEP